MMVMMLKEDSAHEEKNATYYYAEYEDEDDKDDVDEDYSDDYDNDDENYDDDDENDGDDEDDDDEDDADGDGDDACSRGRGKIHRHGGRCWLNSSSVDGLVCGPCAALGCARSGCSILKHASMVAVRCSPSPRRQGDRKQSAHLLRGIAHTMRP